MTLRKHFLEALTLVIAAVLCAIVANAVASRDRKIALVGSYPNALKVPGQSAEPMPITSANSVRLDTAANEVPAGPAHGSATTTTAPTPGPAKASPTVAPTTAEVPRAIAPATGAPAASRPVRRQLASGVEPSISTPAPPPPPASDSAISRFSPHEKVPYVELHGDDVAWLFQHDVLFLDARRTSVFEQGHIAGARSFPVWEADVDERVTHLYDERGNDPKLASQPIVVYCSGGDCEDSHMLAQKLWGVQFNNVYVYKDGFPDWEKRGGQVHKGDTP
jgi:rhodanese-related sulfurtransferase